MPLQSRTFWLPKDLGFPAEYEDAFAVAPEKGMAAIADGVASGMFSGKWARLMTQGILDRPVDPRDREAWQNWLAELRAAWHRDIDAAKLTFFQRQKLQQAGGGYSTLLWIEFLPGTVERAVEPAVPPPDDANDTDVSVAEPSEDAPAPDGDPEALVYRCFAIGDCCLFHVREDRVLRTFPMERSADFDLDPLSICSVPGRRDQSIEFQVVEESCRHGDLLVLASDALAKWMVQQIEAEAPVPWAELCGMTDEQFVGRIQELRAEKQMRFDDTTLLLLRVVRDLQSEEGIVEAELVEEETVEVGSLGDETAPAETLHDDAPNWTPPSETPEEVLPGEDAGSVVQGEPEEDQTVADGDGLTAPRTDLEDDQRGACETEVSDGTVAEVSGSVAEAESGSDGSETDGLEKSTP